MKNTFLLLFLSLFLATFAQQTRQPVVQLSDFAPGVYAFTGANIVLSSEKSISNAILIVRNGIIEAVGNEADIPKDAVVRDVKGAYIYPAFIDAAADGGANMPKTAGEEGSDRPQYTSKTAGAYYWNDAVKAQVSLAQSLDKQENAKDLRALGFAAANVLPNDGIVRGTGVLMLLGDGNARQEMLASGTATALSFAKGTSSQMYPNSLMGAIALIRQMLLDAEQQAQAQKMYAKNSHQTPPFVNLTLDAWNQQRAAKLPMIFETHSWQHTLAASDIAKEFDLSFIYKTQGDEYERIEEILALKSAFIIPLKMPLTPDIKSPAEIREVPFAYFKKWEQAALNPYLLEKNKIAFAFTTSGTKAEEFNAGLQKVLQYGLSEKAALKALTETPASMLGISDKLGTLEKGKIANFIIVSGNVFRPESKIYDMYIAGKKYEINKTLAIDLRGDYEMKIAGKLYHLQITGDSVKTDAEVFEVPDTNSLHVTRFEQHQNTIYLTFENKEKNVFQCTGIYDFPYFILDVQDEKGNKSNINAIFSQKHKAKKERKETPEPINIATLAPVTYPNKGYGFEMMPQARKTLFKNVTVWSNTDKGILEHTDVLIEKGKIAAVGKDIAAPADAIVINGEGKHLTNGIIDEHSHIGILQGVNEYSHAITAEVRIGDALDVTDINIYRQLAGGVTTSQLLHGSANPIGGQSQIIKLRWGAGPEEMKFAQAPPFIKFALGENAKQSNAGDRMTIRYPQTRLGVEQLIADAFASAKDYKATWEAWEKKGKSQHLVPPHKDLQLEALVEILEGKRYITCHSYVQSEVTMLMRLAENTGFKVNTFTHILEGYKIADKIRKHGANASTFSDWWGYKYEVIEATPYNAALMTQEELNVCINSDDAEMGRRLNQEAAKGIKYGGMTEEQAWKMVTLNPAKALHIDNYVGTIEKGKDADIVLWSDNPLSIYAKVLNTYIDGKCYFDAAQDAMMQAQIEQEKLRIWQKMNEDTAPKIEASLIKKEQRLYHCDTEGE